MNALIKGAKAGDHRLMQRSLDQGVDVNSRTEEGATALIVAADYGSLASANYLLRRGADPNVQDRTGSTALIKSVSSGNKKLLRLLIDNGADVNLATKEGSTALMLASDLGLSAIAKLLLNRGAHLNARDEAQVTPLMIASSANKRAVAKLLLDRGAQVDLRDSEDCTALIRAASKGSTEIAKMLIARGANIDAKDLDGNSPLSLASNGGHDEIVNMLLARKAEVETQDIDGDTALILAARSGHANIVRSLLGKAPNIIPTLQILDPFYDLSLEIPSLEAKPQRKEWWAEKTLCLLKDIYGLKKKLMKAGRKGETKHRTKDSVSCDLSPSSSETSAAARRSDICDVLDLDRVLPNQTSATATIDSDSNQGLVDNRNTIGNTPLMEAARHGRTGVVEVLLQTGTSIDAQNTRGLTALMYAAVEGHTGLVEKLLEYGADPDIEDSNGDTALIMASRNGRKGVVAVLVSLGLETTECERDGPPAQSPEPKPDPYMPPGISSLAEFLIAEIGDDRLSDVLDHFAPEGAKGSRSQILLEVLHEADPTEVVQFCLGGPGVRKALENLDITGDFETYEDRVRALMTHFGVHIPIDRTENGPHRTCEILRIGESQIRQAATKPDVLGPFIEACTATERLIRLSVWGWAEVVFGPERDNQLRHLLADQEQASDPLERLSFGHVEQLFRDLPDAVACSPEVLLIEEKLGRRHIYLPKNKKTRLSTRLRNFVDRRNQVVHDKDGYWSKSSLETLRVDLASDTASVCELVREMVDQGAIPRFASISQEIKDELGRITYILLFDDGTSIKVHSSVRLPRGEDFLYFGSQNNPRPVDPLMLQLRELSDIC
jgi:ankyrin repeat protein